MVETITPRQRMLSTLGLLLVLLYALAPVLWIISLSLKTPATPTPLSGTAWGWNELTTPAAPTGGTAAPSSATQASPTGTPGPAGPSTCTIRRFTQPRRLDSSRNLPHGRILQSTGRRSRYCLRRSPGCRTSGR